MRLIWKWITGKFLYSHLQLVVTATDGGTPPKSIDSYLQVIVNRNRFPPRFNDTRLIINIYENQPRGEFKQLDAYDLDTKVRFCFEDHGED